jgi:hypothetical protein
MCVTGDLSMILSEISWGTILLEAVTMFLYLLGLGLGLVGVWTLCSKGPK